MMEQRSQMLRQMRLTKTEREREVSGPLGSEQGWVAGLSLWRHHQMEASE